MRVVKYINWIAVLMILGRTSDVETNDSHKLPRNLVSSPGMLTPAYPKAKMGFFCLILD